MNSGRSDEKPEPSRASRQPNTVIAIRSNYALRAGTVLTAGGSRTQISVAEATGNAPATTSKEGSRAAAIEWCSAEERRLHQRHRPGAPRQRLRIPPSYCKFSATFLEAILVGMLSFTFRFLLGSSVRSALRINCSCDYQVGQHNNCNE